MPSHGLWDSLRRNLSKIAHISFLGETHAKEFLDIQPHEPIHAITPLSIGRRDCYPELRLEAIVKSDRVEEVV
jgi:hypothetical protein